MTYVDYRIGSLEAGDSTGAPVDLVDYRIGSLEVTHHLTAL